jgi:hypothetical protein
VITAHVVEVEPMVNLSMRLADAEVLKALVGGIDYQTTGRVAQSMRDLFHALKDAGVNPDETFSDFFTGKVVTKAVLVKP